MLTSAIVLATIMIVTALLLNVWGFLRHRTLIDRVLVLETCTVNSIALLVLFDLYHQTQIYFESALILAMIGFVSTTAFCKYLLRGSVID
jgi:multicomponent K+:H+ antiporter subunit F